MPAMPARRSVLRVGLAATLPAAVAVAAAPPAQAGTSKLREVDVTRWMDRYLKAWQTKDANLAASLFTRDAVYQAVPGLADQMFRGRDEIHEYWTGVTASQAGMSGFQGRPFVSGNRADIEIWVTMQIPSETDGSMQWVTLIETNILTFATPTLCSSNIEYNQILDGKIDPPNGWGHF
ncbi:nuclear transport factor 2 family protein [Streptomyces sp. Tue6028]|uniref:nuclear transport factor 2 family protein n=1 Tax=Streptomyces sp. Tue6028 TaxID=2036037 RepID=UPI003D73BEC9